MIVESTAEHASSRRTNLLVLAFLALVIFFAFFLYWREMGLYEDDYAFIVPAINGDWQSIGTDIQRNFVTWPQGRPIGFSLSLLITGITFPLGGLPLTYLAAWAVATLNAFLCYLLFRRFGSTLFAFVGACVFALFPADTTHSFLTHAFGLHTALTFLLFAALVYFSKWRFFSYFVILGALLTYESAFLPFLGMPLLETPWNRQWARHASLHFFILAAVLAGDLILRRALGEGRVQTELVNPLSVVGRVLASLLLGPIVVLASFPYRALTPWLQLPDWTRGWVGFFLILFLVGLALVAAHSGVRFSWRLFWSRSFRRVREIGLSAISSAIHLRFGLSALAIMALGYGLSFTHYPPFALEGRATSVHLGATLGGSLFVGWLITLCFQLAERMRAESIAIAVCAVFFASLAAFGLVVQRDFVSSWKYQKEIWRDVVELAPDLEEGIVVLVTPRNVPFIRFIYGDDWAEVLILENLFMFPKAWQPHLPMRLTWPENWQDYVSSTPDGIVFDPPGRPVENVPLESGKVIWLELEPGKSSRRSGSLAIQGQTILLKPLGSAVHLAKQPLYPLLISQER